MLTALLTLLLGASAPTAPVDDEEAKLRAAQLQALEASRGLLVDAMPFSEQKLRLRDVELIVNDGHPFFAAAMSNGKVIISGEMLNRLYLIISMNYMSSKFQRESLVERFIENEIDALIFADARRVSIERLAALTPDELKEWQGQEVQNFLNVSIESAAIFLLAHELGHHALQAFSGLSSLTTSKDLEQRVDFWAADAMAAAGIPPTIGITWTMLYLASSNDYALEFGDPTQMTHHLPSDRAGRVLNHAAELSGEIYTTSPGWKSTPLAVWKDMERQLIARFERASRERARKDLRFFLAAADSGDIDAQLKVGYMYATGTNVTRDPAKALEYRRKAAAAGDSFAQVKVAEPLLNSGDPAQIARGLYWWRRAEGAEYVDAKILYPEIRKKGTTSPAGQRALCIHDAFERKFAAAWTACIAERRRLCHEECVDRHGRAASDCRDFLCPSRHSKRRHYSTCATLHAGPERTAALWAAAESACP